MKLIVVNLQAKVAPLHIGANHLPSSEETLCGSGNFIGTLPEIKKIKNTKKDRPFINRSQHNHSY